MSRDFSKQFAKETKHIVVVGSGGLIGSFLTPLLARLPVGRVTLIDRDVYTEENLAFQDILPSNVGESKAEVQARRLGRLNPALEVKAVADFVENVPLAELRGDVMLAAVDSMYARTIINERAWYLGMPWIDSGVRGDGLLARVNVYHPGDEQPCLECTFSEQHYNAIEQTFPCSESSDESGPGDPPATNSPSYLGALAAALLAGECKKILDGDCTNAAIGRQVLFDILYHNYYVTSLPFNKACRMPLHGCSISHFEKCERSVSLDQIFERANGTVSQALTSKQEIAREEKASETPRQLGSSLGGEREGSLESLRVIGRSFVTKLTCKKNGHELPVLRVRSSPVTGRTQYKCPQCGSAMVIRASDVVDRLDRSSLSQQELVRSLYCIGVRRGDVIRISAPNRNERYFEIVGEGG